MLSCDHQLLTELFALRDRVRALADEPAVSLADRLLAEVSLVLEPAWAVVDHTNASGVGHLRRLGVLDVATEIDVLNQAVLQDVITTFGTADLLTPASRTVWSALANPVETLMRSVSGPEPAADNATSGTRPMTLMATVRPVLPRTLYGNWNDEVEVVPALRRLLRRWLDLARHATGEQRDSARLMLAAAMLARGATLDGDDRTVAWFVERWLGRCPTEYRLDGTKAALLEGGWVYRQVDDEFSEVRDTVTDLRIAADYQHRTHRPVWETQLMKRGVAMLYDPVGGYIGEGQVLIADTLRTADPLDLLDMSREVRAALVAILGERDAEFLIGQVQGLSSANLAKIFGTTPANLNHRRYQARVRLRKLLEAMDACTGACGTSLGSFDRYVEHLDPRCQYLRSCSEEQLQALRSLLWYSPTAGRTPRWSTC